MDSVVSQEQTLGEVVNKGISHEILNAFRYLQYHLETRQGVTVGPGQGITTARGFLWLTVM